MGDEARRDRGVFGSGCKSTAYETPPAIFSPGEYILDIPAVPVRRVGHSWTACKECDSTEGSGSTIDHVALTKAKYSFRLHTRTKGQNLLAKVPSIACPSLSYVLERYQQEHAIREARPTRKSPPTPFAGSSYIRRTHISIYGVPFTLVSRAVLHEGI